MTYEDFKKEYCFSKLSTKPIYFIDAREEDRLTKYSKYEIYSPKYLVANVHNDYVNCINVFSRDGTDFLNGVFCFHKSEFDSDSNRFIICSKEDISENISNQ